MVTQRPCQCGMPIVHGVKQTVIRHKCFACDGYAHVIETPQPQEKAA